ncbi:MAG: PAS domain S-box protein [Candidatus Omnitrophica bacterium]|nr:PAS domain S-box protein [Candidatus Omnitrophota bacterium]
MGKKHRQPFDAIKKSEQEKSVILDSMTELVLYLDTDLRVIWANKAMHASFNLKPGQLNGRHCYEALHDRSRACRICPAERTLQTCEPHEVINLSSYEKNWVLRSYPVRDDQGVLTGIVEIVTDITERRRAEEAMRLSEQKYRELFEHANDIIFILDFNGKIQSCNAAAAKTYGYEPQQLLGLSIEELLDRNYLSIMREFIRKKVDGIDVQSPQEFLTHTKNGEAVWVEVNARIVSENGSPVSIHGIARNITDRKKMEEALRKRERELEEQSRNLEDANTALRVLLKRREEDKAELEEKVICNTRELILPYIENLKITPVDSHQSNQLTILERHINEIISPFLRTLSSKHPNLTPMEIKVITFIREGRTTKEIAELLNVSARTVDVHRDNIRKKLGLKNRKANLRSHLLSLTTPLNHDPANTYVP